MRRVEVTEKFVLPGPGVAEGTDEPRVFRGEAIDALGIPGVTSEIYHAVIEAEAGTGGRVNANNRLYVPEEVREQHEALAALAPETFMECELGHPPPGSATWNIAMRFLGGHVRENVDGSVTTIGRFGILADEGGPGTRLYCLWRAGKPIGLSWKALVVQREHEIEAGSRWAKLNPDRIGETVTLSSNLILLGYDAVLRASAGTYFPSHEGAPSRDEVARALEMVVEAGVVRLDGPTEKTIPPAAPPDPQTEEVKAMKMDLKTLLAEHPELVEQIRREAATEAERKNPLVDLDDADRALVESMIAHVREGREKDPAEYDRALKAVQEQTATDRQRLVDLEASQAELIAKNQELEARLAAESLERAIGEAVAAEAAKAGHDRAIADLVISRQKRGKVDSVEEAVELYAELAALRAPVEPPPEPAPSAGDGGANPAPAPARENAPGALPTHPVKARAAAIAAMRRR